MVARNLQKANRRTGQGVLRLLARGEPGEELLGSLELSGHELLDQGDAANDLLPFGPHPLNSPLIKSRGLRAPPLYLSEMAVAARSRRRGVGKALLLAAEEVALGRLRPEAITHMPQYDRNGDKEWWLPSALSALASGVGFRGFASNGAAVSRSPPPPSEPTRAAVELSRMPFDPDTMGMLLLHVDSTNSRGLAFYRAMGFVPTADNEATRAFAGYMGLASSEHDKPMLMAKLVVA